MSSGPPPYPSYPSYTGSNAANASLGSFGLGDLNPSVFLTPANPGKLIWGVGPTFVFPTATDPSLGQGKSSIGPSFVVLAQPGHWTMGALAKVLARAHD